MINLHRLHIIIIKIFHVVITLGEAVLFARRKLGILVPYCQLLLQLSADNGFIGAKGSAPDFIKFRLNRSARLCIWVLEGSTEYRSARLNLAS